MTETIKTTAERPLRRRDRQLTEDEALQIVRHAPHAVLSTADAAGVPYGVPVNAVYAARATTLTRIPRFRFALLRTKRWTSRLIR